MADDLDITEERMSVQHQANIDAVRAKNKPEAEATGMCLNDCGTPTEPGVRWCCAACRDDWSRRKGR